MQGQRSSMGSLPDAITLDHNSTATDANADQSVYWTNNIQNYNHNIAPEYIALTADDSTTYLDSANQAQNLSGWNMGESSSSGAQNNATRNERKSGDGSNNGVDLNQTSCELPYLPLFMQSASNNTFPHIGESSGEENLRAPSSASGGYFGEEIYSSEGCRLSCKRKAIEGHIGQSSSSGSSSYFQPREGSDLNNIPSWYNTQIGQNTSSTSLEIPNLASTVDQLNARLGLNNNGTTSGDPLSLNVPPNIESSRRNNRVRINSLTQPSPSPTVLPIGTALGQPNSSLIPQSSRLVFPSNISGARTPLSSRWSRGSSSRTGYSLNFRERIIRPNEEPELNSLQRNRPDNPMFVSNNEESRDSAYIRPDWGLTSENTSRNNLSINENVTRSGLPSRTPPRYSRRLSEYVRRSLISSSLPETGGQNSNFPLERDPSSGATGGNHEDRLSRLRSALLERQLDSAFGGTDSLRTATGGAEGRSRFISEIRNVLDLMRRREGLQLEDMVMLDQSGFFGMADIHDRHRDMRLDVDNMSYEELLALEERMGNVSTGLSEETIFNRLKQKKFFSIAMGAHTEVEPCCICREEYTDGEDVGTVECGHEFHSGCIKQWLMLKNSCPICKTAALKN